VNQADLYAQKPKASTRKKKQEEMLTQTVRGPLQGVCPHTYDSKLVRVKSG